MINDLLFSGLSGIGVFFPFRLSVIRWKKSSIKKPCSHSEQGLSLPRIVLAPGAFRCLERIDLLLFLRGCRGNMRSQIAVAVFPFLCRIRTGCAEPTGTILQCAVATVTTLYDFMTNPAIVGTPLLGHKWAFTSFSNCCTLHWNHPLLMLFGVT